jgi:hypothetical protein
MRLKRFFHRTPAVLGTVASIIAIGGVAIGAYKALQPSGGKPTLPERRQIVAFHQLANDICSDNKRAMERALSAARSHSELLAYLARATNWGVGDLSGVTPPPSLATAFADEIQNRRAITDYLLDLQRAFEIGNESDQARVKVKLASAEARAIELNRALGLAGCAPVMPSRWLNSAADTGGGA